LNKKREKREKKLTGRLSRGRGPNGGHIIGVHGRRRGWITKNKTWGTLEGKEVNVG